MVWLNEDRAAQKAFAFENMCAGWAMGSQSFKRELVETHKEALASAPSEVEAAELKQMAWCTALERCMKALGKDLETIRSDVKSADWKVAIAAHLRRVSTVKNPWLAEALRMGDPDGVSRYVSEARRGLRPGVATLEQKIAGIRI